MDRLVFRPYTRVGRSICTSEPRRSSTRVSSGFNLPGHSSPSFGSRHARSSSLQPARWRLEGPAVRSRGGGRSRLGIDEQLLRFRCALGFTSPSDSRACQTPRSVFQDGSVEVPTGARGIAPPRRDTERKRAPAVGGGPSGTSPHPVEPTRRHPGSSSPEGDQRAQTSVPATASDREVTSRGRRDDPTTAPPDFRRSRNRSPRDPQSRKCARRPKSPG